MKQKSFGNVHAFNYSSNSGPQEPGISVNLQSDRMIDLHDGEWLRLDAAKRLLRALSEAVAYVEAQTKPKAKRKPRGEP